MYICTFFILTHELLIAVWRLQNKQDKHNITLQCMIENQKVASVTLNLA